MLQLLNYRLTIAYDGSNYKGWQNNRKAPSIEGTLQQAIERIQQHPVKLDAASRTDAGVHAEGQIVNFRTPFLKKYPDEFLHSANSLLPPDIRILDIALAPDDFHPTLNAVGKTYHYLLSNAPILLPKHRWTTWHYPHTLDIDLIKKAADDLIGTHDFGAFCNQRSETHYAHTIRTLTSLSIDQHPEGVLKFVIEGNNFLYNMVRIIVGTLAYVGRGLISLEAHKNLLKNPSRPQAGITAPARGLCLYKVHY